jgi:sulfate transport system ATP-binding protein
MAIEARSLEKHFGDYHALDDVSFTAPDGQITALLGPSGGGKSTLLRVISGLEQPDGGTVHLNGEDVTQLAPQEREVGFVFQHYAPFRHMTVRDNVGFGLSVRKRPKEEVQAKAEELLDLVQLGGLGGRYPDQLSGGQRQRMALARALAVEPKVLLLDEPFGALDARVRKDLRGWLRRLHEEVHVTTLFVTHDQEEAMELAHHVVVLSDGKVEQAGHPTELYEDPANEFVMGFVGPVTKVNEELVRPHDLVIHNEPQTGTTAALVERVLRLGFEVRVEVLVGDDESVSVQLSAAEAEPLDLFAGQRIYLSVAKKPALETDTG